MKGKLVLAWAGPGKGTRLIRGETWMPYQAETFPTPPFPEYVSGHSTFSSAGAQVLRSFTGSDLFGARVTVPRGSSFVEPGLTPVLPTPLLWATFSAAVDEAGRSRRFGGIHFPDADLHGRTLGTLGRADRLGEGADLLRRDGRLRRPRWGTMPGCVPSASSPPPRTGPSPPAS